MIIDLGNYPVALHVLLHQHQRLPHAQDLGVQVEPEPDEALVAPSQDIFSLRQRGHSLRRRRRVLRHLEGLLPSEWLMRSYLDALAVA